MRAMLKALAFGCLLLSFQVIAQTSSPVGQWLTIDDETNTPRSIVSIWDDNGSLKAKIDKIYFREGEKDTDLCTKCKDAPHKNQRILGMTIMWGMKQDTNRQWQDGYILDPKNGEIYHCKLTLSPNGRQLTVRGYIGIPLIGRSQTWNRVE